MGQDLSQHLLAPPDLIGASQERVGETMEEVRNMLSQLPINLEKVARERLNQEILRAGMVAELDASQGRENPCGRVPSPRETSISTRGTFGATHLEGVLG